MVSGGYRTGTMQVTAGGPDLPQAAGRSKLVLCRSARGRGSRCRPFVRPDIEESPDSREQNTPGNARALSLLPRGGGRGDGKRNRKYTAPGRETRGKGERVGQEPTAATGNRAGTASPVWSKFKQQVVFPNGLRVECIQRAGKPAAQTDDPPRQNPAYRPGGTARSFLIFFC